MEEIVKKTKLVVLIEDDPDVFGVVLGIFGVKFGDVKVVHIDNGSEVFEHVSSLLQNGASPDLIILDLMLPGANGFEICSKLREKFFVDKRKVPILAITGYDSVENKRKILQAGATDYLPKPFDIEVFVKKIKKYLFPEVKQI
jgi:two-component system sensor histidine kinase ChiS